ncbi:MAG: hypothetical protein RLZ33_1238, partial [Bacteroidota bacterium]
EQKTLKMLVLIDNKEVEIELTKVDLVNW